MKDANHDTGFAPNGISRDGVSSGSILKDGISVPIVPGRTVTLNRRQVVAGLASGSVVALSGCVKNEHLGRSQLMIVSDEQLIALSNQTWSHIVSNRRVLPLSATETKSIQKVGGRVVDAAGMSGQRNWQFWVLDDPSVNAFVMPGGQVAFNRGIVEAFANDDQAATVMGHEVGHVVGRHAAERASQRRLAGIGLAVVAVALVGAQVDHAGEIAAVLGAGVTFGIILPYSRQHEYEADRLGVRYMAEAGYRPKEAVAFWQTMQDLNHRRPMEFMSTHPSDANRIKALRAELLTMGV